MCTAGFWKDKKGTIHYFKNRMLRKMPQKQWVDFASKGIFVCDENGRFEGMNKYGLFAVSLSMDPSTVRKNPRPIDINRDIMLHCKTAKAAKDYFLFENEKYDMGFIELIGDSKNVFYIEVTPDQITYTDLSQANYFACANHGQLLAHQGKWQDRENSSHLRLQEAQNILLKTKKYEDLKKLLCCHKNAKKSGALCAHNQKFSFTVGAYLFTPACLSGEICLNEFPCKKGFQMYQLGKNLNPKSD